MSRLALRLALALALLVMALPLTGFTTDGSGSIGGVEVGIGGTRVSVGLDGSARRSGIYDPGFLPNVVVSPDGRWRAVRNLDQETVAIGPRGAHAALRVVERHLYYGTAAISWSPDSRWLALTSYVPGRLSAVAVSPDGRRQMLAGSFCGGFPIGFAWAPRSERIVLEVPEPGAGCAKGIDLRERPVGAGSGRVIARRIAGSVPAWSADGRWIATTVGAVEVMRADGSGRRRLPGVSAVWSPRGAALALATRAGTSLELGVAGGAFVRVARGVKSGVGFSPDGRLLVYARSDAIIVLRTADRHVVLRVPIGGVHVDGYHWAADGRRFAVDAGASR